MADFLGALMRSLGFLTRLPVAGQWFSSAGNICDDTPYFPIAGIIIGFLGGMATVLASVIGFNDWVAAAIGLLTIIVITGALHEDGLADVTDAFFVSKTKDERLTIMKDSHIGTFGTLSLVFCIGIRTALLGSIITKSGLFTVVLAFAVIEAVSRGGMVWLWVKLPLVRKTGTAASAGQPSTEKAIQTVITAAVILVIAGLLKFGFLWIIGASIFSSIFISAFASLCEKRIGGYTGDVLGATQQCLAIILTATISLAC